MADISIEPFSGVIDDLYKVGKTKFAEFRESSATKTLKRRISKHVQAIEKVRTIWQIDRTVKILDFYYPSRVRYDNNSEREVDSIEDLSADRATVVIEGTQGQGKSIFLRYLAIQQLINQSDPRIPLFVELKNFRTERGLGKLILNELVAMGFRGTDDLLNFYLESGSFVILLDAFDEIDPEIAPEALYELLNLARSFSCTQFIITTRPDSDLAKGATFTRVKLAPLRRVDFHPFLRKLGLEAEEVTTLTAAIFSSHTGIQELVTTPLLLTLLIIIYKASQTIPSTLSEFYKQLFTTLISRHDNSKPGLNRRRASGLDEIRLRALFDSFSFISFSRRRTRVGEADFLEIASKAAEIIGIACDPQAFKKDITKITCLMVQDGHEIAFVHRSVQEYHVASFVASATEGFAQKFYEKMLNRTPEYGYFWWRLPLGFLALIDRPRWIKYFRLPQIKSILERIGFDENCDEIDHQLFESWLSNIEAIIGPDKNSIAWRLSGVNSEDENDLLVDVVVASTENNPNLINEILPAAEPDKLNAGNFVVQASKFRQAIDFQKSLSRITERCRKLVHIRESLENELRTDALKLSLLL